MNYEFLIGTAIGIAGIIITLILAKDQIKSSFSPNCKELFARLTNKNLSPKEQKQILRKINHKLKRDGNGHISSDYINNFEHDKKGESLFYDICNSNDIEPTQNICIDFLGYDSPKIRKEWKEKRTKTDIVQNRETLQIQQETMNTDKETNIVYLSETLPKHFSDFFKRFTKLLDEMQIKWELLSNTNDIWARDYMPIQLGENDFLKYKYNPDYLRDDSQLKKTITDCEEACKAINIKYRETELVIDGGNMIPCGNYIVMTDKVFTENGKEKNDTEFLATLEKEIGKPIIIIPWHRIFSDNPDYDDVYGHADGFIKWCGGNKVLMSNHRDFDKAEAEEIIRRLTEKGFVVTEMLFDIPNPDYDLNWAYINLLQIGNKIIMPKLNIPEDKQAEKYVQEAFPDCEIKSISMRDIVRNGGALHCVTWNIKTPL